MRGFDRPEHGFFEVSGMSRGLVKIKHKLNHLYERLRVWMAKVAIINERSKTNQLRAEYAQYVAIQLSEAEENIQRFASKLRGSEAECASLIQEGKRITSLRHLPES